MTYHRLCDYGSTTCVTSGAGTAYHSGTHEFHTVFPRSFVFCVVLCRSLFIHLSFFIWVLWCLSLELRILITHLVSSNFSKHTYIYHIGNGIMAKTNIHLETKLLAQEILWSHGSYLSHLFKHVISVHTKYCIQIARVKMIVICYDTCI